MKYLLSAALFVFSIHAYSHGAASRVEIELESSATVNAGQTELVFQLVDTKLKQVLTNEHLNVSHEKKLHVLLYDSSLTEFIHIHPEFTQNQWRTTLDTQVNGKYFLWAQGELSSDGEEFSALSEVHVVNGKPAHTTPPNLVESRKGNQGLSVVSLGSQVIKAGKSISLQIKFSRSDLSQPEITPYLGAFAHIVATASDGDSLVHVHPMSISPTEGVLHVRFPRDDVYRLWVQFIDAGELKVVPLAVKVVK